MSQYITPNQAADLLMVSPITLRTWENKGLIRAAKTAGGHRRYSMKEIEKFAHERGISLVSGDVSGMRVLIVDDEASFAKMLSDYLKLKLHNCETSVALSGFEAGLLIESFQPNLVLMDLSMPDINGCEVCRIIKNTPKTKNIRVIAMTGSYSDDAVKKSIECGAETCVPKPVDIENLLEWINR